MADNVIAMVDGVKEYVFGGIENIKVYIHYLFLSFMADNIIAMVDGVKEYVFGGIENIKVYIYFSLCISLFLTYIQKSCL